MNWIEKHYNCTKCNGKITFRYAFKNIQFFQNGKFIEVTKSAACVLCADCGGTFWIPSELKELSGK